jgi:hypothetical protein
LPNEIKLAVKKISPQSKQHGKDELQREIFNLKSLHHENLVQLFDGYSIKDLHLLAYDYMHKGSLHHALFGNTAITRFHPALSVLKFYLNFHLMHCLVKFI